jgi:predicted SprT family Zn-dependent metalloprotease
MDTLRAKLLAEDWLRKYNLRDHYTVQINSRMKRRFGYCRYARNGRKGIIAIGEEFCQLNTIARVEQTIKHEVAHALTGYRYGRHHGIEWKRNAIILGVPPVACAGNAIVPSPNFYLNCSGCGQLITVNKRPPANQGYRCRQCRTPIMSWQWKKFEKKPDLDFLNDED